MYYVECATNKHLQWNDLKRITDKNVLSNLTWQHAIARTDVSAEYGNHREKRYQWYDGHAGILNVSCLSQAALFRLSTFYNANRANASE